jgi:hypothetical protein
MTEPLDAFLPIGPIRRYIAGERAPDLSRNMGIMSVIFIDQLEEAFAVRSCKICHGTPAMHVSKGRGSLFLSRATQHARGRRLHALSMRSGPSITHTDITSRLGLQRWCLAAVWQHVGNKDIKKASQSTGAPSSANLLEGRRSL